MFKNIIVQVVVNSIVKFLQSWLLAARTVKQGITQQRKAQLQKDQQDAEKASGAVRDDPADLDDDRVRDDPKNRDNQGN